jgi:hypothetical protein
MTARNRNFKNKSDIPTTREFTGFREASLELRVKWAKVPAMKYRIPGRESKTMVRSVGRPLAKL